MTTFEQRIQKLYGENYRENFEFDSAKPQTLLDAMAQMGGDDSELRNEIYQEVYMNTVYAYCKHSRFEGFLPLTYKARQILDKFGHRRDVNLIFTPLEK